MRYGNLEAGVGIEPAYTALQGKNAFFKTMTYGAISIKTGCCNF
jgi:hypothetical protein